MAFWINTVSRDHVAAGVAGGFTQANHGRPTSLRRVRRGDLIAFYSPRTSYPDGERLQAFTAIVHVTDDEPFQVEMRDDFHPWRRAIDPIPASETPIGPLIDELNCIPDKRRWGLPFRRGLFEIRRDDFQRIARAMRAAI
jgi:hypothetical protein